ncbi:MAG TPA: nitroreductase family protein [Micromonosporaceae bacterium]|nr:nitroreductase family protein [Micromonosporaceae bacterium]
MELAAVMRSAASVREYLPADVPDEVLYRVFERARFAPNGGNRQGWRLVVVRDPALRRRLRDLYQHPWREYAAARYADAAGRGRAAAGDRLADTFHHAPVLLAFWVDLAAVEVTDADAGHPSVVAGGSIFPFIQNVQLALRAEGLGSRITTLLARRQAEVRALLAVPDGYALAAVMPVGRPARPWPTLSRRPVETFATVNRFDGPALLPPMADAALDPSTDDPAVPGS